MSSQLCPNVNLLGSFRCSFTKLLRPSHCNVILGWKLSQKSSTSRQMSWSSLHDYTEPHATDCAVCVTSSVARSFCCVWCNTVGGNVNWHVFRNVSECFGHVCHLCALGRSHSEWSGQRLPYLKAVADLLSSQHGFLRCLSSQDVFKAKRPFTLCLCFFCHVRIHLHRIQICFFLSKHFRRQHEQKQIGNMKCVPWSAIWFASQK